MKPLFVPLFREYFENFESGKQRVEIRPYGPKWNRGTCWPGRPITISYGYGKQRRIHGVVSKVIITEHMSLAYIEDWHIDAVNEIYGSSKKWILIYVD